MKFTVDVSEALNAEIRAAAAAAGVTRAEWVRVALAAAAHPDPIPPHPGSIPADGPAAGADLGALADAAAALRSALEARDEARHELAAALAEEAELAARLAHVEGVAEERLRRVGDAAATIARLTPEADRTPMYLPGPGVWSGIRSWWAGLRRR